MERAVRTNRHGYLCPTSAVSIDGHFAPKPATNPPQCDTPMCCDYENLSICEDDTAQANILSSSSHFVTLPAATSSKAFSSPLFFRRRVTTSTPSMERNSLRNMGNKLSSLTLNVISFIFSEIQFFSAIPAICCNTCIILCFLSSDTDFL